jgi:hypothetical protein
MTSKRAREGYILIDHRDSPGSNDMLARKMGMPVVGAGEKYESATICCSHCQRVVVLNPDRTRERGYCRKCDHYICDVCTEHLHQTGICRPMKQVLDEAQETAARAEQNGSIILTGGQ